jgi:hypothetical protein
MLILAILSHTPLWVWGMLAALLALGASQVRSRQVAPLRLLLLPLVLLGLGLSSLGPVFMALPLVGLAWAAALVGAAVLMARRSPAQGVAWLAAARRLQIPGSWAPLLLIVLIFCLRYALAVSQVLHPAWRSELALQFPAALLFGTLSGGLLGRNLSWLKLSRAR